MQSNEWTTNENWIHDYRNNVQRVNRAHRWSHDAAEYIYIRSIVGRSTNFHSISTYIHGRLSCGCTIRKVGGEPRKLPINFRTRRFLALRGPLLSLLIRSLYSRSPSSDRSEKRTNRSPWSVRLSVSRENSFRPFEYGSIEIRRALLTFAT